MRLPRVSAPVHGIDFSQMPPQCPSSAHLNSANGVDVSCDLNKINMREKVTSVLQYSEVTFLFVTELKGTVKYVSNKKIKKECSLQMIQHRPPEHPPNTKADFSIFETYFIKVE